MKTKTSKFRAWAEKQFGKLGSHRPLTIIEADLAAARLRLIALEREYLEAAVNEAKWTAALYGWIAGRKRK